MYLKVINYSYCYSHGRCIQIKSAQLPLMVVGNCNWERAKPNCPTTQRSAEANYSVISNQSKMRGETGEYLNCCSEI